MYTSKLVVIAGTPGTGKSSIGRKISEICGVNVLDLSKLALDKGFIIGLDEKRNTYIIDEEKLIEHIHGLLELENKEIIVQTHYPEILPSDRVKLVFVLRTNPLILEKRLQERGWSKSKINENTMAEILGVVVNNAISAFGEDKVVEIDTSNNNFNEIAEYICRAIRDPSSIERGVRIDWLSVLDHEDIVRFNEYVGSED